MDIRVRAYVDISDVLDEIDTEDLVAELKSRGKSAPIETAEIAFELATESLAEIRDALRAGRHDDALVMMDRLIEPRFKTFEECEKQYKAAMREARTQ